MSEVYQFFLKVSPLRPMQNVRIENERQWFESKVPKKKTKFVSVFGSLSSEDLLSKIPSEPDWIGQDRPLHCIACGNIVRADLQKGKAFFCIIKDKLENIVKSFQTLRKHVYSVAK